MEPAAPKQLDLEQALERMTSEEIIQMNELRKRIGEMQRLALARPTSPLFLGNSWVSWFAAPVVSEKSDRAQAAR